MSLKVIVLIVPLVALSAQTKKAEYPYVVSLRTLNEFGHQEVYTTYYPKDDKDKKAKLQECMAFAPKVVGAFDSHYKVIISSTCTVDR